MRCAAAVLGLVVGSAIPQPVRGQARADAPPISRADVDFVTGMISHHAQALVMAGLAPERASHRAVQVLCARIINGQTDEITNMQRWLRDRGLPVPEAKPMPTKMMMGDVEHEMMMPGMLTDEQMKELEASTGPQFDHTFLIFMIQHHEGAIAMVNDLLGAAGTARDQTIYRLAADVFADQTAEIERMQQLLLTLP